MKKLIFNELIKLILVTFVVFSFVACGGGGSSGGDDYSPAPIMQTNSDGTIQITAPRYDNDLPVTLFVNGAVVNGNSLSLQKDNEASFVVQQADYNNYSWSLDGRGVTPGTLNENGRTCTFTPESAGIYNILIIVTKDGLIGSLSVNLVVSE
ncbi:MAG: hypothetical protein J6Y30_04510 [Treponema sp.]|nr:hypothetical protein [Treponema sp.]